MSTNKLPPRTLRFVIRDSSPMMWEQEPVKHRSVAIELTDEQREKLRLSWIGKTSPDQHFYEEFSIIFFEEGDPHA